MKNDRKVHYAWFVCAGCALLVFCSSGLSINAFTVYQPYILTGNGFTNAQSSLIITFRYLFGLISLLFLRRYYRVFSLRTGMAVAGAFLAVSFALFSVSSKLWMYCLSAAFLGVGYGLGSMVPVTIMLEHWFTEKRNTAIGICSASTGLATLGIPSLISGGIEKHGLRPVFLAEAAAVACLAAICFILVRNSPAEKGLTPYGQKTSEISAPVRTEGLSGKDWLLLVPALLMVGGVMSVSYSHLTVLMNGEGFSPQVTALAITVSGVSLMTGKIIYGRICDRIGVYRGNFCFIPMLLAGLGLCCVIRAGKAVLFAAMVLYSFGIAYLSVGLSSWVQDLSSTDEIERTLQRFQILYSCGGLIFSPLPGIMADARGGSYTSSYILFLLLAVLVVTAVQICFVRVRKRRIIQDVNP